jgi:SAM-dependent methyltransferase
MDLSMHSSKTFLGRQPPNVQDLINSWFPPASHPYRSLERQVQDLIKPDDVVLEIGCGRTAPLLRKFKGTAGTLMGIDLVDFTIDDPDIQLLNNDVADMKDIADGCIDFAFSRSVIEHVSDIDRCYAEIYRILKPGGTYLFLTPNFWDYGSLISYLTPNQFHPSIVARTEGRAEENTFPAFYRSNTRRSIGRLAKAHDFQFRSLDYLGQYPAYFVFSRTLFILGAAYEKLLARHASLHWLQGWMLCTLEKTGE